MEERISTNGIKDYLNNRPKKERKAYTYSEKTIESKKLRQEERLKSKLIAQVKSEDPRYFLTDENLVKIDRLPGETYRLIPTTTRYYVSDFGNALKIVYDKKAEKFIEHKLCLIKSINKTKKTYIDITVQLETGEHIRCRLSRAMAKTFIDPTFPLLFDNSSNLIVDHIDNNSENNKLSNIRICTQQENLRSAVDDHGKVIGMPKKICYAYNIDTFEVRQYNSTAELVQDIFGKNNNGWFSNYSKNKSVNKDGWVVGYDLEEIKTYTRREGGRK